MSRPNFAIRVPSIPIRPKPRIKKFKKKSKLSKNVNDSEMLQAFSDIKANETKESSYYTIGSSETSVPRLRVIETYDEFLNLKDLDKIFWSQSREATTSAEQSNEGLVLLKQICADLNLEIADSDKEYQVTSLFQTEHCKNPNLDIRTAIIAQRIIETQEQIANSRKNSLTGFSRENLRRNSFNKSSRSLGTINEVPPNSALFSGALSKTLSNLTSRFLIKPRYPTSEIEVQVSLTSIVHSCNTQTHISCNAHQKCVFSNQKNFKSQHAQSSLVLYEDKHINTTNSSFYPNHEQSTQMYEHITENDLFCMEWINKNLFRVPVNPNTVIIDEKLRESSELTCVGTNFLEQELNWEREALCP